MPRWSRRAFVGLLSRTLLAALVAPFILWRRVFGADAVIEASGPSLPRRSIWIGRGCSAAASALSEVGAMPARPYDLDFTQSLAVVVSGVDLEGLSVESGDVQAATGLSGRSSQLIVS